MISTIVVPLDMSDVSETTLPLARTLARVTEIPVKLVTVMDVPDEFLAWIHDSAAADEKVEQQAHLKKYLDEKVATFENTTVETVVLEGRPARQIVEYVDGLENPILIMASHGRTGFKRLTVGSVTARVVHSATCPVIVTRASHPDSPTHPVEELNTILVPLDGSQFAERALDVVDDLLGEADVEFRLIRIPESVSWQATPYGGVADYQAIEMYMDAVQTEASDYLKNIADEMQQRGRKVSWEVSEGLISDTILAAATECDADGIAMSSHGRTGFRRFFMGSVAERVLNEAAVPIFMVGPGMADEDEDEDNE